MMAMAMTAWPLAVTVRREHSYWERCCAARLRVCVGVSGSDSGDAASRCLAWCCSICQVSSAVCWRVHCAMLERLRCSLSDEIVAGVLHV